jgi:hypothetical protein
MLTGGEVPVRKRVVMSVHSFLNTKNVNPTNARMSTEKMMRR